jgi:hypothetical protein
MAITNYGELKTAIRDWMFADADIASNAADFVTLAQGYLNRRLRCRDMITQATLSIDVNNLFALPSDYLQWRNLVEVASLRRPLSYITQEEADEVYPDRPSGLGVNFTIIGSNIRVYPVPANDLELTYYAHLGAFPTDADTDWLLTKFPNLYLAAGCMMAAEYLKDDGEAQKQLAIVDMYVGMLSAEDDLGEMSNAGMHIEGHVW